MKKMYRASYGSIKELSILKDSPTKVTVSPATGRCRSPYIEAKKGPTHAYFHTWKEARLYLMLQERSKIIDFKAKLFDSESVLERIIAMQDPTKTEEETTCRTLS